MSGYPTSKDLEDAIQPDGGLQDASIWLLWSPERPDEISLDGFFTVENLKWIVAHIEKVKR